MSDFELIMDEFSKPLKEFIKRRVRTNQDAEDILQDIFLKIYKNISNLNDSNKIHAWIYQITKNAIVDYYRVNRITVTDHDPYEDIPENIDDETNMNAEIGQCINKMIQLLPDKYREALVLTEFQNLTQKELADRLGLSLSGAKSRVQRARYKLKELLLGCCSLELDHFGNVINYDHKCDDCKFC